MDLSHLPPSLGPQQGILTSSVGWYEHTTLNDSIDCIRLVYLLQERVGIDGKISCTLKHVPFAHRPKYDALSYTWGESSEEHTILIEGKKFIIKSNLFRALSHFVNSGLERVLWIDAICIDQTSVEDKNRQLKLMPYIYRRAQKVLVWLDWREAEKVVIWNSVESMKSKVLGFHRANFPLLYPFGQNTYWERLWIVQEVGRARDLEVHYDEGCLSWASFISCLQSAEFVDNTVPLQLQKEREDSYRGSHTMLNLMRSHQDKLCKDRRDKIYALIGLARDVADSKYPVNYDNSLEQVYFDAIAYRTSDVSWSQHDMVEFSQLTRQLLGVFLEDKKEEGVRLYSPMTPERTGTPYPLDTIRVSVNLLGRIVCVGPTVEEILGDVNATERWNDLILEHGLARQRQVVSKESDLFLGQLEHFYPQSQNVVELFKLRKPPHFMTPSVLKSFQAEEEIPQPSDAGGLQDVRLFLLQHLDAPREDESFVDLALPGTRRGSFVCQISGIQRAIVLSVSTESPESTTDFIGCAAMARPAALHHPLKPKPEDSLEVFHVPRFSELRSNQRIDLDVDVQFIHYLSRPPNLGLASISTSAS